MKTQQSSPVSADLSGTDPHPTRGRGSEAEGSSAKAGQQNIEEHYQLDPFCVEKNLRAWASSRIISRGRDYYRKGNVLSLESYEDNRITAQVEGTMQEPYHVEIKFDRWKMPVSRCTCPFDWEPLCKHAVAVLIAWQQEEMGSEPNQGHLPEASAAPATERYREEVPPQRQLGEWPTDIVERDKYIQELADIEREDRRVRCTEEGIHIVRRPDNGPLGTYTVSSTDPGLEGTGYKVAVRDANWAHASCSCPDFLKNELGTCKHIEIVRKSFKCPAKTHRLALAEKRSRRISVYARTRESHNRIFSPLEEIRFHVPPSISNRLPPSIYEALDRDGYMINGRDPELQKTHFNRLLKQMDSAMGKRTRIDVDRQVHDMLRTQEEASRWQRHIEKIAGRPKEHRAWRDSVGAMKIRLHPYQVDGILFAVKKRRAFIGDDMGLGKTVQAIGASLLLKELKQINRAVVICPASLKFQWKREIEKVSSATSVIISGSARQRDEQYKNCRDFFLILNYELLYRDLDSILSLRPGLIILDEAQRIKNWETKIAQNIKKLESPFKLVLTGTPLQNRLNELHSISEFLNPKALGAAWKLIPTYAHLDENDRIAGYSHLDHLRRRMDKFLIRRTRQAVLAQLPKRTDNSFWTNLTSEQADVHDELSRKVIRLLHKWEKFKRLTREDIQRLLMLLTCMRIVSNAYGQYDWKSIELEVLTAKCASAGLKKKIGSPKLEEFQRVVSDMLEDPAQKVVVFSQWERMIRLADIYIRETLESTGSRSVMFSGGLSLKKRDAQIKRFIEDPATRVFFSTDAGGLGLNLQQAANCVINLEIPWNPAVLEQRIGRIYRMGQKKSVEVINFISSECVEEKIFNIAAQKKALFSGLFDKKTNDIRFNAVQTASFMDKMKMMVPASQPAAEKEEEKPAGSLPEAENAATDSVAKVTALPQPSPPGSDAPEGRVRGTEGSSAAMELDLGPAVSALSSLLKIQNKEPSTPVESLKLKVSEDREGVHLCLPKPALELLKGFRPVLETLLKLG